MPFYANLDTDRIERVELQVIELGHTITKLASELETYLADHKVFQHSPDTTVCRDHRRPTLHEYVGTLSVNAYTLTNKLSTLRAVIDRGSVNNS